MSKFKELMAKLNNLEMAGADKSAITKLLKEYKKEVEVEGKHVK